MAIDFIVQNLEGESNTKPLQDSSARVMEGEIVLGKGQKYVWVAYWVRHKKL